MFHPVNEERMLLEEHWQVWWTVIISMGAFRIVSNHLMILS